MGKKAQPIEDMLQTLAEDVWGTNREKSMEAGICVKCQAVADSFRDSISMKEYGLTGWCQKCQDDFFGGEEE